MRIEKIDNPQPPSTVWTESIIAKLELVSTECGHCPAGERLEVLALNQILELFDVARSKFLLVCSLQGFELKKKQP